MEVGESVRVKIIAEPILHGEYEREATAVLLHRKVFCRNKYSTKTEVGVLLHVLLVRRWVKVSIRSHTP